MAIIKFMLGNLKNRKSYSIIICILVFLAGLMLTVTLSTAQNAGTAYDRAISNIEGPHLMFWISEAKFKTEFKEWFEKQPEVESVKLRKTSYFRGSVLNQKGVKLTDSYEYYLFEYNRDDRMKLIDAVYSNKEPLNKGEIYLPYIFKTTFFLSVGDSVNYAFGTNNMDFKIAGFIEEPLYGNELNGGKYIFISNTDMDKFLMLSGKDGEQYLQLRVSLKSYNDEAVNRLRKNFMKINGDSVVFVNSYNQMKNSHLSLPKIALGVMIIFAAILCLISITVMRYAILATIEADYLNIGIVKSLGFTPLMVQISITGQYALLTLLSGTASLIVGILLTPVIGQIILKSSGLYFSGKLSLLIGVLILVVLVFIITFFSYITSRRTKKISPLRAINIGIAPIYLSSRLNVSLEKIGFLPFDLCMGLKQVITKSKRYIVLISISALLAFSLVFSFGFVKSLNSDKSLSLLGIQFSDIRLKTKDRRSVEKMVADIKKDYKINEIYYQKSGQYEVEGESTMLNIKDSYDTDGGLPTIEGRHPKYDNEVAISSLLKSKFNKGVGQFVTIKDKNGVEHQFLITGIFQTIDEFGSIVRMNEAGIKVLEPDFNSGVGEAYIKLKTNDNIDKVIKEMKERYTGYDEISNQRKAIENNVNTIKTVFSIISKLVFVLTIIMISFITLLVMKITIYAETRELGIFKALGFSSARIRRQLALRFVIVTVTGSVIGVVAETLLGSQIISFALRVVGISSINMEFSMVNALLPLIIMPSLAIASAYISSGNTKKVSAYILISE